MIQCSGGRSILPRTPRAVAVVVVTVAVLGSAACGIGTSAAELDATFVDTLRSEGRDVPAEPGVAATLVSAARKLCDRREKRATPDERHAARLTRHELEMVNLTFDDDARRFTLLALETYCPN